VVLEVVDAEQVVGAAGPDRGAEDAVLAGALQVVPVEGSLGDAGRADARDDRGFPALQQLGQAVAEDAVGTPTLAKATAEDIAPHLAAVAEALFGRPIPVPGVERASDGAT
jgi:hypothetical protein